MSDFIPIPEVDAVDAQKLIESNQAVLVDVRENNEWEAGHAPNAQHIPLSDLTPGDFVNAPLVIVICRAGGRSAVGTQLFNAKGVNATNLTGGMQAWQAAGLPVVTDDGAVGQVV